MNNLIGNYVNKMTLDDINNFFIKNNIYLSSKEIMFIYDFVKKNWSTLLNNSKNFDLSNYQNYFSQENYLKLNDLLNEYKTKYYIYLR